MGLKRRAYRTLIGALLGVSVLVAGFPASASVAQASTPTWTINLGPIGFGTVTVDKNRSHVLVSGPTGNVVEILSYTGALVTTVPNIFGAAGMVVNGDNLYVAESTAGAIVKVDLDNPTNPPVRLAHGINRPYWLVATGGMLWTADASGQLVSINPSTGAVSVFTSSYYGPDLATSPGDPSTLFLAEDGLSPGAVYRLDVSSGTPVVVASNPFTTQENIEQLAVSPDGLRVIPASGWPYEFDELRASTLQPDGIIYPGNPYPSAVAVSPGKGGLLATGLDNGYSSPDIEVDPIGVPAPIFTATTTNSSGTANVRPHGLALTPQGTGLFAVLSDDVYGTNTVVDGFVLP